MDGAPTKRGLWPHHAPWWLSLAAILAMTFLAAPAGAQPSPATSPCQPWGDETYDGEELWATVAAKVPAFAGFYVNEETRTLYVLLTDRGESLEEAVHSAQTIIRNSEFCEFAPVALPARYSYVQLKEWYERMGAIWSIEGLVFDGIEEDHNRIAVGVEDLAKQGPLVEAKLADLGIPREVVKIIQHEPIVLGIERRSPWPLLIVFGFALAVCAVVAARFKVRRRSSKDGMEVHLREDS